MFTGNMQENLMANLSEGWNYLPVLNACDNLSEDLFNAISGNLQIVKEVAGPHVYWPQFGINTLELIQPGKSYFVLVDDDVVVEFPDCDLTLTGASRYLSGLSGQTKNLTESTDLSEFELAPTPITHTIAIPLEVISGLTLGDVIRVHGENGQYYGAAIFQNNSLALTAYGDDPTTTRIDGMTEGETLQLRIIDAETGKEYSLEVEYDTKMPQGGYFVNHGLSAVKSAQATGIELGSEAAISVSIYPNPSNGIFNIYATTLTGFAWKVNDIHGSTIAGGEGNAEEFTIDLTSYPKGIYYLKITYGGFHVVKKLVVQ